MKKNVITMCQIAFINREGKETTTQWISDERVEGRKAMLKSGGCKMLKVSTRDVEVTDELIKKIACLMNAVWQTIGGDILQAVGEGDVPRAEVIECVTDADRLYSISNSYIKNANELAEIFYAMPEKMQKKVALSAFPYKRYGY